MRSSAWAPVSFSQVTSLFEIPGALIAERYSPKWWLARIMITWGIASGLMAFISTAWQFYVLRFLLGVAEASLYPVLYASCIPRWFSASDRPRAIALMLASLQVSSIIGAPLAGWLIGVPLFHFQGWQGLFILEAIPAIVFGFVLVRWMADWPKDARWLTPEEKQFLTEQYEREVAAKSAARHYTVWQALRDTEVLKLVRHVFPVDHRFLGIWLLDADGIESRFRLVEPGRRLDDRRPDVPLAGVHALDRRPLSHGRVKNAGMARAGMFLAAAGMLFGTLTDNPTWAFLFMCMAAIGVYAPFGVWWSYPTTFLSGSAAAGAIGLINSFGNIGGFVGPYLIGFLKDTTGSYTSGWLYLAFSLTCAGLLILTFKRSVPTDNVR